MCAVHLYVVVFKQTNKNDSKRDTADVSWGEIPISVCEISQCLNIKAKLCIMSLPSQAYTSSLY